MSISESFSGGWRYLKKNAVWVIFCFSKCIGKNACVWAEPGYVGVCGRSLGVNTFRGGVCMCNSMWPPVEFL